MNIQTDSKNNAAVIVIFGASGDLTKRKLFPALYSLYKEGLLSENFAIVGVARQEKSAAAFREDVFQSIEQFSHYKVTDQAQWDNFVAHFEYYRLDVNDEKGYIGLNVLLSQLDTRFGIPGNRLFYLAMAPNFFGPITLNLKAGGLTEAVGWKRLVIEKPFGHDHESAQILNNQISQVFNEEEIFRIDHYLGKEMVQNITVVRFANILFESVWNNNYIANVQITSSETVGVETRGDYYEKSGALRDMVQNHMLQMVTMIAMEPPSRLKNEAIRDEKVKVMRSLRRFSLDEVNKNVIRAQYTSGYNGDTKVAGY
ncbi:MAG: glucose-6-phosphate dehydrogenase, partial [Bacilli bacterium]